MSNISIKYLQLPKLDFNNTISSFVYDGDEKISTITSLRFSNQRNLLYILQDSINKINNGDVVSLIKKDKYNLILLNLSENTNNEYSLTVNGVKYDFIQFVDNDLSLSDYERDLVVKEGESLIKTLRNKSFSISLSKGDILEWCSINSEVDIEDLKISSSSFGEEDVSQSQTISNSNPISIMYSSLQGDSVLYFDFTEINKNAQFIFKISKIK